MAINLNTTKCPHCKSSNKAIINHGFFHCNQCGYNYYDNKNISGDTIVKSGKAVVSRSNHKSKSALPFIAIILLIMSAVIFNAIKTIKQKHYHELVEVSLDEDDTVIPEDDNAYQRTAYVLYKDSASQQFLYKATFLTRNTDEDDSKAVIIKQEDNHLAGYDASNNDFIPNFDQLIVRAFSPEAVIVYSDRNNLIVKNKVNDNFQLEMIDSYKGEIVWTLSEKELPEMPQLMGKYSEEKNGGIVINRGNFRVKLRSNYYDIDRKGQIIGFGVLNDTSNR